MEKKERKGNTKPHFMAGSSDMPERCANIYLEACHCHTLQVHDTSHFSTISSSSRFWQLNYILFC